ncbi:MAG TPA: EVE domain-containing protein [Oscillatoriaceae cyanobacterium M33_DOE_052]|uniref:EVE domain-containing protein n=1 Tax=Planktothricoides sp. SpSt-374 TaxID=2282167 RepID=A0A7C3VJ56_9CYAN|nr:EVE domain-containing protein [Oscillatoriaceae cyanobacterium M33_DOE_052]
MAYWLFQGNPKYYKLRAAIQDFSQIPWLVTRYHKEIAAGDGALIWMAGTDAGIYAIGEVVEPATLLTEIPDIDYWLDKSKIGTHPQAQIRFTTKLLDRPLLRTHLMQDEILKDLGVIRQPNATNFKVPPAQWQRVHSCIRQQT